MRLIFFVFIVLSFHVSAKNYQDAISKEKQSFVRVPFKQLEAFAKEVESATNTQQWLVKNSAINQALAPFDYQVISSKKLARVLPLNADSVWSKFFISAHSKNDCVVSLPVSIDPAMNQIGYRLFAQGCHLFAVASLHPDSKDQSHSFYAPWRHPQSYFNYFLKGYLAAKQQARHIQLYKIEDFIKPASIRKTKLMLSHSMPMQSELLKDIQVCLKDALSLKVSLAENNQDFFEDLSVVQRNSVKNYTQFIRLGIASDFVDALSKDKTALSKVYQCLAIENTAQAETK